MSGVRTLALSGAQRLRAASAAAKATKGGKKAKADVGPTGPVVPIETREKYIVGANILKEGSDPAVKEDSEYPDWLWHLLDKQPPLSELKRKKLEDMDLQELIRLAKLDTRSKIKENNTAKSKS